MDDEILEKRKKLIIALRRRARRANRKANVALVLIFILLAGGLSLFYFAGEIAITQSKSIEKSFLF
jgi:hypothetical protein